MCWLCMYMGILECIRVDHDLQTTITHISNTLVVDVYIFDAIHVFVMLLFYMILSVLFHVKAFSQTNLSELLQESGIVPAVHEACGGGWFIIRSLIKTGHKAASIHQISGWIKT